jgi:hypothetical protein
VLSGRRKGRETKKEARAMAIEKWRFWFRDVVSWIGDESDIWDPTVSGSSI